MKESKDFAGPPIVGGSWTDEKLEVLRRYLESYTAAMRGEPVRLMYIDAFAVTGGIDLGSWHEDRELADYRGLVARSAKIALGIMNRSFNELVFIEADRKRVQDLEELQLSHAYRSFHVYSGDANVVLRKLQRDWRSTRGVLFLDSVGLSAEWSTIERLAGLDALDTWILFPVGALSRIFPRERLPEEISLAWAERLTAVYGNSSWEELYSVPYQGELFGNSDYEKAPGVEGLLSIYKDRLSGLFGRRFLTRSVRLRNSWGVTLYEFIFCAGNSADAALSKDVAAHIMDMNHR